MMHPPSPPSDPEPSEAERWSRLLDAELQVLRSHLVVLRRQHSELGLTIEETEEAISRLVAAIERGDP